MTTRPSMVLLIPILPLNLNFYKVPMAGDSGNHSPEPHSSWRRQGQGLRVSCSICLSLRRTVRSGGDNIVEKLHSAAARCPFACCHAYGHGLALWTGSKLPVKCFLSSRRKQNKSATNKQIKKDSPCQITEQFGVADGPETKSRMLECLWAMKSWACYLIPENLELSSGGGKKILISQSHCWGLDEIKLQVWPLLSSWHAAQ